MGFYHWYSQRNNNNGDSGGGEDWEKSIQHDGWEVEVEGSSGNSSKKSTNKPKSKHSQLTKRTVKKGSRSDTSRKKALASGAARTTTDVVKRREKASTKSISGSGGSDGDEEDQLDEDDFDGAVDMTSISRKRGGRTFRDGKGRALVAEADRSRALQKVQARDRKGRKRNARTASSGSALAVGDRQQQGGSMAAVPRPLHEMVAVVGGRGSNGSSSSCIGGGVIRATSNEKGWAQPTVAGEAQDGQASRIYTGRRKKPTKTIRSVQQKAK